ncbi:MAG: hypothetical protein M9934_10795 [Thermomicrobiales bacterium]|nr:hypothetical protein [Thermomicrobiales bacterium]MCO5219123.1 hypothetical protein [Thermomicrobiales bacterium]MCO5228753.1 hypothetical protein [Thermomicrobiales bacterium]
MATTKVLIGVVGEFANLADCRHRFTNEAWFHRESKNGKVIPLFSHMRLPLILRAEYISSVVFNDYSIGDPKQFISQVLLEVENYNEDYIRNGVWVVKDEYQLTTLTDSLLEIEGEGTFEIILDELRG